MTWGPDVETNLAISSANHLKVRFIQQSHHYLQYEPEQHPPTPNHRGNLLAKNTSF
ncbi:hypothetical protein [Arsenophonus endosymbiont of Aphis craccivora]|uniref:hypothetical protein n=1 Tax=Arsenophonus endosymbiont of Aphis craccivora TaxID=1231049 RepID=UPI0034E1F891